jgi:endo-1,4-beta-xylanase
MNRRRFVGGAAALAIPGLFLSGCQLADSQRYGGDQTEDGQPSAQPAGPAASSYQALRTAAQKGQLHFGSAVHGRIIAPGSISRSVVANECSSITPEWSMKWNSLCASGPDYDFGPVDAYADFATDNRLAMRGHTLLWHLGTPDWAEREIATRRDWRFVDAHIQRVVSRYQSRVFEWDVINEPISDNDNGDLRENQFLSAFGPDYLAWALHSAAAAAPEADLFINEYGLEYATEQDGRKRLALLRTVERLLDQGAPITGVGLQGHLDLRKGTVYENGVYGLVRDLTDMGMKVAVTELDVREADVRLSLERRDTLVADAVDRFLETVLQFPTVTSVSTWGLSDAHSWLTYHPGGLPQNRGLPYDRNWAPKPMRSTLATMMGTYRSRALSQSGSA